MIISLLVPACATFGSLSENSRRTREYPVDFNRMKTVVERAVKGSNFNIDHVSGADSNNRMVLTVNRERYVGNESVQQEQGEVRIIKVDEKNTRVEIDNPEYHFSVPEHQRKDYQRLIFGRIDELLEV